MDMNTRTNGWRVIVRDELPMLDAVVNIGRALPDGSFEVVTDIEGGVLVTERSEPHAVNNASVLNLRLPPGLLEALADGARPAPSAELVKELRDTLAVERRRVDAAHRRVGQLDGEGMPKLFTQLCDDWGPLAIAEAAIQKTFDSIGTAPGVALVRALADRYLPKAERPETDAERAERHELADRERWAKDWDDDPETRLRYLEVENRTGGQLDADARAELRYLRGLLGRA